VFGYGGFRSGTGRPVRHHLLPLGSVTLILDLAWGDGLITGARGRLTGDGGSAWGTGVTVGLTPAGVSRLLGVPMRELTGEVARLSDLVGRRAAELAEKLAAAPGWAARFALLDSTLIRWDTGAGAGDPAVSDARRRLRNPIRVGALADQLGIGRRQLERAFQDEVGISLGTVARIARFQRAVNLIGAGASLAAAAAGSGYTDQSHLSRATRAMAGVSPAELRTIVQYHRPAPA
jgi:AraC-like DNA-binding protein